MASQGKALRCGQRNEEVPDTKLNAPYRVPEERSPLREEAAAQPPPSGRSNTIMGLLKAHLEQHLAGETGYWSRGKEWRGAI